MKRERESNKASIKDITDKLNTAEQQLQQKTKDVEIGEWRISELRKEIRQLRKAEALATNKMYDATSEARKYVILSSRLFVMYTVDLLKESRVWNNQSRRSQMNVWKQMHRSYCSKHHSQL